MKNPENRFILNNHFKVMVNNAFPYQFLANVHVASEGVNLPNFLKDILRRMDLNDYAKLEEFFSTELQNAPLQNQAGVDYFFFIARQALFYAFSQKNKEGFTFICEMFRHRLSALRNVPDAEVNTEAWQSFIELAEVGFSRLVKHNHIEAFESHISEINWNIFDKEFIGEVSGLIGRVYLGEPVADQAAKARLWLQKSINEQRPEQNIANYLLLADHLLQSQNGDSGSRIDGVIRQFENSIDKVDSSAVRGLMEKAVNELKHRGLSGTFSHFDDNIVRLEHGQKTLKDLELMVHQQRNELPAFSINFYDLCIADLNRQLYTLTTDDLEQASFSKHAVEILNKTIERCEEQNDTEGAMYFRLKRADIAIQTGFSITEKEVREFVQYYKKGGDYTSYLDAVKVQINLLNQNDNAAKSYDAIQDIFKMGVKKIEEGGFYLLTMGLKMANDVFLAETKKPGVSWMIHILDEFFERVRDIVDMIEEHMERIGNSMLEQFRQAYIEFEPASHFNIKTYFSYQLYELKVIRLGMIAHHDTLGQQLAEQLISELETDNNPLSFIRAHWKDDGFKDVPNSVRNKTLNKCINISKGDLPLAAKHLDFSYRNLRSYITFKEVNRLGFFLDIQETSNKQLEQGIRYMFYDLYKRGTIFEVVFDMPKFLVNYAQKGFYSQDLERELNIKGTTAKKYIKIMMEIELIRQDKTTGRKHYYRLIRENVMKRLGKDQNTLIQS